MIQTSTNILSEQIFDSLDKALKFLEENWEQVIPVTSSSDSYEYSLVKGSASLHCKIEKLDSTHWILFDIKELAKEFDAAKLDVLAATELVSHTNRLLTHSYDSLETRLNFLEGYINRQSSIGEQLLEEAQQERQQMLEFEAEDYYDYYQLATFKPITVRRAVFKSEKQQEEGPIVEVNPSDKRKSTRLSKKPSVSYSETAMKKMDPETRQTITMDMLETLVPKVDKPMRRSDKVLRASQRFVEKKVKPYKKPAPPAKIKVQELMANGKIQQMLQSIV